MEVEKLKENKREVFSLRTFLMKFAMLYGLLALLLPMYEASRMQIHFLNIIGTFFKGLITGNHVVEGIVAETYSDISPFFVHIMVVTYLMSVLSFVLLMIQVYKPIMTQEDEKKTQWLFFGMVIIQQALQSSVIFDLEIVPSYGYPFLIFATIFYAISVKSKKLNIPQSRESFIQSLGKIIAVLTLILVPMIFHLSSALLVRDHQIYNLFQPVLILTICLISLYMIKYAKINKAYYMLPIVYMILIIFIRIPTSSLEPVSLHISYGTKSWIKFILRVILLVVFFLTIYKVKFKGKFLFIMLMMIGTSIQLGIDYIYMTDQINEYLSQGREIFAFIHITYPISTSMVNIAMAVTFIQMALVPNHISLFKKKED